jgi:hypothetical protein
MPADDYPFDALEHQLDLEDASVSPVNKAILYVASSLPLPWPINKAVGKIREHLGSDSLDRIRIMLEVCVNELRRHDHQIEGLHESMSADELEKRAETWKELLLDAARKAEATRAKDRLKRIGMILAHSALEPKPIDADEIDEMMRVAMELSDRDTVFLRELVGVEGVTVAEQGRMKVDPKVKTIFRPQ